jgi:hypothetical protein
MKAKSYSLILLLSAALVTAHPSQAIGIPPLPMELVGLQAIVQQNEVLLAWTTMSESNSSHFVIERSADGIDFTAIGSLNAAGSSLIRIDYKWADEDPLTGPAYYRLRQMDMDGSWELSNVVTANYVITGEVAAYPNPAYDLLSVETPSDGASEVVIKIFDNSGRPVHEMYIKDGRNITTIPIDELRPGTYLISSSTSNGHTAFGRFVKR